ncbi:MAG TPA: hypothetical protein VLJ68_12115 [Chitinophagaceae bacterium]|nr:hypothetical protein [Chitinophagaceae bacterium]
MSILIYFFVFMAALLVDVVPLVGPPAWTVMVFFQIKFDLDIWAVLLIGVTGSAIGRYIYSVYVPLFSDRFIKPAKNADLKFIGGKFANFGWKVQLFVLLYTLMPLPSTPLFTAAGIARIKTFKILPAFFAGKFISDAVMVIAGNYVAMNATRLDQHMMSWKSLTGMGLGVILIGLFLFTDWKRLLTEKRFGIRFNIWK